MLSSPVQDTPGTTHLDSLPVTCKAHCDWIRCWVPAPFSHCRTLCVLGPGQTGFRGCPRGPLGCCLGLCTASPLWWPIFPDAYTARCLGPLFKSLHKGLLLGSHPPSSCYPPSPVCFPLSRASPFLYHVDLFSGPSRLAHLEWKLHEGILSGFSVRICQVSNDTTSF